MSNIKEEHLKIRCITDEHLQQLETSRSLLLNHRTAAFLGSEEAQKCAFISVRL